eukprot:GHVH01010537.1.p1 GENE.GHVH01010537.1~~GHVH01010537.1.p1  ORF type:complete len:133 (+),score=13.96 GHVH01010537.1:48-401(+)
MSEEIRCAHILVKHSGSRNPVSRRTGEKVVIDEKTAIQKLQQMLDGDLGEALTFDNFPKFASENSDCGSFSKQGDLGFFKRGQMQKPFEEAAFALLVHEMSGIVRSDSGYHLIIRIA